MDGKQIMSQRLVQTYHNKETNRIARLYRNTEYEEWIVRFTEGDKDFGRDCDYYTMDLDDARGTALVWIDNPNHS